MDFLWCCPRTASCSQHNKIGNRQDVVDFTKSKTEGQRDEDFDAVGNFAFPSKGVC